MALDAGKVAKGLMSSNAWWHVLKKSLFWYAVFQIISYYVVGTAMGPPEFFGWWWQRFLDVARWIYELFSSKQAVQS